MFAETTSALVGDKIQGVLTYLSASSWETFIGLDS